MGRLIDESDVMKMLTEVELSDGTFTEVKSKMRDLPTSYDVEKVVAELEKESVGVFDIRTILSSKAIEIVRKAVCDVQKASDRN